MFLRRSKSKGGKRGLPKAGNVRDQVADVTDDLTDSLEAARDAITKAMRSSSRRGADATRQAARKTTTATKQAGRRGRRAARELSDLVPEPEAIAEATRRATDKLLPALAKQRRKEQRKRKRRLITRGAGLLGLLGAAGMIITGKLRRRGEAARYPYQTEPAPGAGMADGRPASATATGPQQSGSTTPASGAEAGAGPAVAHIRDEGAPATSNRRKS
ncbi:MAG TPA: hypothetical protein VF995_08660 [Actinomycetota bacterium]